MKRLSMVCSTLILFALVGGILQLAMAPPAQAATLCFGGLACYNAGQPCGLGGTCTCVTHVFGLACEKVQDIQPKPKPD